MRILQTGFGNDWNFRYRPGTFWQKLSLKLPLKLRLRYGLSGPPGVGFSFGHLEHPTLMLTTEHVRSLGSIVLDRALVVNPDGSEFEAGSDAITTKLNNSNVQGWRLKAFPRREEFLTVRFIFHDADWNFYKAADFKVKNLAFADYPHWKPESLPISKSSSNGELKLIEFVTGLNHEKEVDEKSLWYWKSRKSTRLAFESKISQPGKWKVVKFALSDPTGNYWEPNLETPVNPGKGDTVVEFIGGLWPGEPVWKIHIELMNETTQDISAFDFCAEAAWSLAPM